MFFRQGIFVLLLQVFCAYHIYKNGKHVGWYFLIFFVPVLGSLIYLGYHFLTKKNIEAASESIQTKIQPNLKVQQLEEKLRFSDTYRNRTNLGDEYLRIGRPDKARIHFEKCLEGIYQEDPYLLKKLLTVYFELGEFDKAITLGEKLENNAEFKQSKERVTYAWALKAHDLEALAKDEFEEMDIEMSNYFHRWSFAKFLSQMGETAASKKKLEVLMKEIGFMSKVTKQANKDIIQKISASYKRGF